MPLDNVVFWVFAPISVASAVGMLLMRNAVHAALFLVVNFFCLAVFYLILDAPFLFAVQIIVYAGAIMVLFLFVIMLLGVDRGDDLRERLVAQRPLALVLGAGFVIEIVLAVRTGIGFATNLDGFLISPGVSLPHGRRGRTRTVRGVRDHRDRARAGPDRARDPRRLRR